MGKHIENQQIHINKKSGDRRAAATKELEQLFPESQLDMEWYKEHGYCIAEDFFKKMRNKYHYDIQSSEEVICDNETK